MPSIPFAVIFQNLAEKYPVNAHIECKYTLTRSYEPNARDWIGLYKVLISYNAGVRPEITASRPRWTQKYQTLRYITTLQVGWSSPRDYKTYQWVAIPSDYRKHENNVAKVMFQGMERC